jgi:hypothetical protein
MLPVAVQEYLQDARHCPVLFREVAVQDISLLKERGVLRDCCIRLGSKRLAEYVFSVDNVRRGPPIRKRKRIEYSTDERSESDVRAAMSLAQLRCNPR